MFRSVSALLAVAATLLAHHSVEAEFDKAKETEYKATVTKVAWVNPHVLIHATVPDAAGKNAEWVFEVGSPGAMKRNGWGTDDFRTGEVLAIRAYPAKDGSAKANTHRITWASGRSLENNDSWKNMPLTK